MSVRYCTFLAEVAGRHRFVEPLLDLVVDELHKGVVLGRHQGDRGESEVE